MAIAKKVGKDRRGNRIYRRDRDGRVLDHFRNADEVEADLHEVSRRGTVLDFPPEVDQYGRMVNDDLPIIASKYHEFLEDKDKGSVNYDR